MSNIFFIGDTHFGHEKILHFENGNSRKGYFSSIEEHDETIIDNWNRVVRNRDTIYHLGDVAFKRHFNLARLKGYKKLILGNHDNEKLVGEFFHRILGALKFKRKEATFMITHIPIHPSEFEYRVDINLHGHLHCNVVKFNDGSIDPRYINLSADQLNFTPIEYSEMVAKYRI